MYLNYLAQNVSPSAQAFALLGKHQVARFLQNEKELLLVGRRGKEEAGECCRGGSCGTGRPGLEVLEGERGEDAGAEAEARAGQARPRSRRAARR